MHKSDERILITHVGSVPRHPALRDLLVKQDRGEPVDEGELERQVDAAVEAVAARQLEVGIDVGNDGEQPRAGFSTYVARRMRGFGGESKRLPARAIAESPDYAAMLQFRRRAAARIGDAPQAAARPGLSSPRRVVAVLRGPDEALVGATPPRRHRSFQLPTLYAELGYGAQEIAGLRARAVI